MDLIGYDYFDLVYRIRDTVIGFSRTVYTFMFEPLGNTLASPMKEIIGTDLGMSKLIPWSPIQILGGVGFFVVIGLYLWSRLKPN